MASPYAVSPQPSQAYYAQPPTQHAPSVHVHPMLSTVPTIPREFQKWIVVIKLVSIVQLIFSIWLLVVSGSIFFLLYIPPAICGIIGATKLNKPLLYTYTGLQAFLLVLQMILTFVVVAAVATGKLHGDEVVFYILQMLFWHLTVILSIIASWKVTRNIQITVHAPATELQSFAEVNVLQSNTAYPAQQPQVSLQPVTQMGSPVPFGVQTAYAPIVMQEMTETQANQTPLENSLGIDVKTPKEAEKDTLLINV